MVPKPKVKVQEAHEGLAGRQPHGRRRRWGWAAATRGLTAPRRLTHHGAYTKLTGTGKTSDNLSACDMTDTLLSVFGRCHPLLVFTRPTTTVPPGPARREPGRRAGATTARTTLNITHRIHTTLPCRRPRPVLPATCPRGPAGCRPTTTLITCRPGHRPSAQQGTTGPVRSATLAWAGIRVACTSPTSNRPPCPGAPWVRRCSRSIRGTPTLIPT